MNRRGFIDGDIVIGLVGAVMMALACAFATGPSNPDSIPDSQVVRTVKHDDHWLIMAKQGAHFMHHPDCPCGKEAEKE